MMYHLDGRWRRQSLVYFGEPRPSDLAYRHTRNPRVFRTEYVSTYRTSREANRGRTFLSDGAPSVRCS